MPVREESGYQFELPDDRTFRFEECATYRNHLKAHELKEMDFGWITDTDPPAVWLAEVSNYGLGPEAQTVGVSDFLDEAVQKISDSLLMLSTVWAQTSAGQRLRHDIEQTCPNFPEHVVDLRVAVLLGFGGTDAPQKIQAVANTLRPRLKGRMRCMGASSTRGGAATLTFSLQRSSPALPIRIAPVS